MRQQKRDSGNPPFTLAAGKSNYPRSPSFLAPKFKMAGIYVRLTHVQKKRFLLLFTQQWKFVKVHFINARFTYVNIQCSDIHFNSWTVSLHFEPKSCMCLPYPGEWFLFILTKKSWKTHPLCGIFLPYDTTSHNQGLSLLDDKGGKGERPWVWGCIWWSPLSSPFWLVDEQDQHLRADDANFCLTRAHRKIVRKTLI